MPQRFPESGLGSGCGEQCTQGVDGELGGVTRGGRQAAEFVHQLVAGESGSLRDCFLANEFGERRSTRNGGDAALGLETDF